MANSINNNFFLRYKSTEQLGKNLPKAGKEKAAEAKDPLAQFGGSASVELSPEGLALSIQQKGAKDEGENGSAGVKTGEEALSPKAQDFLSKLREKYGDYDFFIADDVDNPLDFNTNSTKKYSVIISSTELEKMAADEEYADKVMGQVEKAIGVADKLESEGKLGEGVSFSKIAISIDAEGNMKLFAELERASQEQQERLEKAQEKKEEEAKKADKEKEKEGEEEEQPPLTLQHFRLEASSEDELWEKILGIDWSKVAAE